MWQSVQLIKISFTIAIIWLLAFLTMTIMITRIALISSVLAAFFAFMRGLCRGNVSLYNFLLRIGLVLTWVLFGLSFFLSLLFISFHHLFEIPMLFKLLLLFLFFIQLSLFSLLLQSSPCPGICVSFFVIEYRFVVNVFEAGYSTNHTLAVVWNFLIEWIIMHVDDG